MSGEFVAFIDSDDYVTLDMVERCVTKITQHPEVDMLRFAWEMFWESGRDNERFGLSIGDSVLEKQEALARFARHEYSHTAWSGFYRKQLISDLRFKEGVYAEDTDFLLNLFASKDFSILFIEDILYKYRINEESITHSKYDLMWRDAIGHWVNIIESIKTTKPQITSVIAYGLFTQLRLLEEQHRVNRTQGEQLKRLQELCTPGYEILKHVHIDWTISNNKLKDLLYWYAPKLRLLLRPSDWGVESIRK